MEEESSVWLKVNVVGRHATCHVVIGCGGACWAHGGVQG